jgi:membrane protein DedA with SNARE-associated domain
VRPLPLAAAAVVVAFLLARRHRLPWSVRLVAAVIAVALAIYGSGAVDPPDLEELLLDVGGALGSWTYLLVGLAAFLETGAFVGLVVPGETAVIAGGVIAGQGYVELVPLLLLVWACCIAGDNVSYLLGRWLGRGFVLRHGPRLKITEGRLVQVERFFERRGGMTILIGRFIGLVRALAPFVAGTSRMPYAKFLPYDIVGTGLWASAFVLLGYFSWRNIDRAAEIASTGTLAFGATVALVIGGIIAWRTLRTAEQRRRALAWLRAHTVDRRRHNERKR